MYKGMHVEVREQLVGVGFLRPLCGLWGLNSDWQQAPLYWVNLLTGPHRRFPKEPP